MTRFSLIRNVAGSTTVGEHPPMKGDLSVHVRVRRKWRAVGKICFPGPTLARICSRVVDCWWFRSGGRGEF
jgi:hypothetical protein